MVIMASGIASGIAQSHNMAAIQNGLTETCSLGLLCTYLILAHHVMINWHLSKQGIRWLVSRDQIAGSSLQFIEVKCFFEVDRWPSADFSIGSRAHVWLTCWKQGRFVWEPVKANPGLKVNRIITFLLCKCFCCFVLCLWWLLKLKPEGQTIYRKPQRKVWKFKFKFSFFLG